MDRIRYYVDNIQISDPFAMLFKLLNPFDSHTNHHVFMSMLFQAASALMQYLEIPYMESQGFTMGTDQCLTHDIRPIIRKLGKQ